jgi:hypothetical protein
MVCLEASVIPYAWILIDGTRFVTFAFLQNRLKFGHCSALWINQIAENAIFFDRWVWLGWSLNPQEPKKGNSYD